MAERKYRQLTAARHCKNTYAGGIVALATQIIVTLVTTRSGERSDSYQLYKEARKEMKAAIAAGKRV